jgi:Protein of unknown function (DUF3617)
MPLSKCAVPAAVLAALVCAGGAAADELPAFKQGLWSYTSTISLAGGRKPQARTVKKCTSPTEDIKKKWASLASKTCPMAPLKRAGAKYTYSSSCEKNGVALRTLSVITVESDASYRVDTETHTNNIAQKETLVAQRVGDCAK